MAKFRLDDRFNSRLIQRKTPLSFTFNGKMFVGFQGDTLASALLAEGVHLVGRSFKYHRPRGILSAGSEEPNALVTLEGGAEQEPNVRAPVAELYDGMVARSQNFVGSLGFDFMAINDWLAPFLTAGFYYKTFMWPPAFWEKIYEPMIRRAAGLGELSGLDDPTSYDRAYLHCDLLVIGGGAAGLMAALTAGQSGVRVIIAEEDFILGGRLNHESDLIDGKQSTLWARQIAAELASLPNVRVMTRTTIFGAFDHGVYGALEQGEPTVLYRIYSKKTILAAGAIERPIAFADNDRPAIMLAGAVRSYLHRYDVAVGQKVAVFTNNNDGWRTAQDLVARGVEVAALIDTRKEPPMKPPKNMRVITGAGIAGTKGRLRVRSLKTTTGEVIAADAIAVSGGWSPTVHLTCHRRGRPLWNPQIAGFVSAHDVTMQVIGAAQGDMMLSQALKAGHEAGIAAADDFGKKVKATDLPDVQDHEFGIDACFSFKAGKKRAWVDFQNDVTTKDIQLAHQEGFSAPEHLKRYTTLGMATDQGKTANVLGLAVMAEITQQSMAEVGTTIFRPPYTPVPIAAFAGRARGEEYRPTRLPPSHAWAQEQGAVFVEAGAWMRAQWFPRHGEKTWLQSVNREVVATRSNVGICDVSTLGKIDIKGRDAGIFIDRVYANGFASLPVGKTRYGLMLREDGFALDDGTVARLADDHYVMTTTTVNAGLVYRHLELYRQGIWPDLDVTLISVTDQFAQFAVAGPKSRHLLERIVEGFDLHNKKFPFMAAACVTVCGGIPARLFRISFSGELAYELAVPARYGDALIRVLIESGDDLEVMPYGLEALNVMRIEKGHLTASELNGQASAHHLGLGGMLSHKKDFIGKVMAGREALCQSDGLRLVGLKPVDPTKSLSAGAHFLELGAACRPDADLGYMTSVAYSPWLNCWIGLGFVKNGASRMGEIIRAADFVRGTDIEVEITSSHFIDPDGRRLHG